ncbi:MAG: helix-turn-helix domain-containing protein [Cyanobacteria bacterium P01_C01_bin.38]
MSDQFQNTEPYLNYILQTDLLETPNLTMKVVTESPADGVSYQESYSDPCLVINFGAQLSNFEVEGDKKHGYQGPVIPGDFSFLPPETILEGCYQGNQLCYAYIMFPKERLNPLYSEEILIMQSDSLIKQFAQAIYSQANRNDPDIILYRESILEALIQHLQLVHLGAQISNFKPLPNLERLESYIQQNLAQKLTVTELALLEQTTAQSLQKAVRKQYCQSVYEWVTNLRLERSLELLRGTSLNLATIAIECGFANQSHWTRLFRRKFGITPGKVRHS